MNKLAIVVLNWNGADIMQKCIDSLLRQSYENFRIIIVDNDSRDNSIDILKKLVQENSDKIHVIYNDKNSGFSGGVNIGIRYAMENKFHSVALFNNDAVAEIEWLKNLSVVMDNKNEVGVVTGLLLNENGKTIDSTGDWYSKWGLAFPRNRNDKYKLDNIEKSGYVFSGSGGASLYRVDMLKDIGLFDESFFAYYEDVDVSFRAQLAGWKVYYTDKAIAYHEQGGSSKKIPGFTIKQTFRNLPLLYIKNVPRKFILSIGVRLIFAYWLMFFNTLRYGNIYFAAKGWLESIILTPSATKKRFHIQKNKKVDDRYISEMIWQDLPPDQTGIRKVRRLLTFGRLK